MRCGYYPKIGTLKTRLTLNIWVPYVPQIVGRIPMYIFPIFSETANEALWNHQFFTLDYNLWCFRFVSHCGVSTYVLVVGFSADIRVYFSEPWIGVGQFGLSVRFTFLPISRRRVNWLWLVFWFELSVSITSFPAGVFPAAVLGNWRQHIRSFYILSGFVCLGDLFGCGFFYRFLFKTWSVPYYGRTTFSNYGQPGYLLQMYLPYDPNYPTSFSFYPPTFISLNGWQKTRKIPVFHS